MNHITRIILTAAVMTVATTALAGTLTPPGAPTVGSGMPTLADIYNQLDTGATTTPSGFQGPTSGPASASGRSLNDIKGKLPAADMTNGATAAEVKAGKTFWGLRTDGTWGVKTGTLTGGYTCTGTMNGTRWCDNNNGTVRDMTTGLLWLKDASGGGKYSFGYVLDMVSLMKDGDAGLTDGSAPCDWRMPTKAELVALTTGTEAVRSGTPRAFTGVQSDSYWSSGIEAVSDKAWYVNMGDGNVNFDYYSKNYYVWPVRSGQ